MKEKAIRRILNITRFLIVFAKRVVTFICYPFIFENAFVPNLIRDYFRSIYEKKKS